MHSTASKQLSCIKKMKGGEKKRKKGKKQQKKKNIGCTLLKN